MSSLSPTTLSFFKSNDVVGDSDDISSLSLGSVTCIVTVAGITLLQGSYLHLFNIFFGLRHSLLLRHGAFNPGDEPNRVDIVVVVILIYHSVCRVFRA